MDKQTLDSFLNELEGINTPTPEDFDFAGNLISSFQYGVAHLHNLKGRQKDGENLTESIEFFQQYLKNCFAELVDHIL